MSNRTTAPHLNEFTGEILDTIATYGSLYTVELSRKLTTWATRNNLLQTYGTYNTSYEYWEISGATITKQLNRLLPHEPNLIKDTNGTRILWKWKPTIERREKAAEAKRQIAVEQAARVRVVEGPHEVDVVLDNYKAATFVIQVHTGWNDGEPVYTPVLDASVAKKHADALAHTLRAKLINEAPA